MRFYIHNGWHFLLADAFPLRSALEKHKDAAGRFFYEREYEENGWEAVTLPHTFNDGDLFKARIEDAGSGQKRTCAFYRKWLTLPDDASETLRRSGKAFIEFEGMRQTCYLYVNGRLAGYYEAGAAPFGFDLTPYLRPGEPNLLTVATDNTATRNIGFCIAETPNRPDAEPGSYLSAQDEPVPPERAGVGFQWNCNDFNPSVGGITRPVKLHVKPTVYLTLPLYSNLLTKGVYVYGKDYDPERGTVRAAVQAEVRNESGRAVKGSLLVRVRTLDGAEAAAFSSEEAVIPAACPGETAGEEEREAARGQAAFFAPAVSGAACGAKGGRFAPLSITPGDAYRGEILPDGKKHYVPVPEDQMPPVRTASEAVSVCSAVSEPLPLRFWDIEDPYLYRVEVTLCIDGQETDSEQIETGFRQVSYEKDRGVMLNGRFVWLTGYAQRAANEWAAIGIAPEWLKDMDARLIRESGADHIRWMHVAASPADIRSLDRNGIVCTQPAGDKEAETFGRSWGQRLELMRDVIVSFRNHPSIFFWEAGNNSIDREHMRQMRLLKEELDPDGGRFMGCRTINTEDVLAESEYVGTMLNRHAARFLAEHGPITETEYSREEAPRRIWDDFTPPDFDYRNRYIGKGGKKQKGRDFYDLTMEELALAEAAGYSEFFHDRIGGASGKDLYSACAGLCWTDSAQHGRQSWSENGRMSGRVDPVRVRKQNFYLYQVMQSQKPMVHILGHWNYPADTPEQYRYPIKRFNGQFWEETGEFGRRDPRNKTVYVAGSYAVMKTELFVNGRSVGVCEKPTAGFLFAFPGVDVTEHGRVEAVGYDCAGNEAARAELFTAGAPASLRLTPHVSPEGFLADGADIAYIDVEVLDENGRICPLCSDRIDFRTAGPAVFLGGYNSGRFDGYGKDDSVIHQNHVYAECGINRVFLRAAKEAGEVRVEASMEGLAPQCVTVTSVPAPGEDRCTKGPAVWYADYEETPPARTDMFPRIPEADAVKYEPEDQLYCKVLVNGQEPDTRGVRSVNKNGSIWGAVLCILERMQSQWGGAFTYAYDADQKSLTVNSGSVTATARAGQTHLLVNGQENLMDGEPYVTPEGIFVMEVNAIVPYIQGTSCQYDEKVNVLRIGKL